MRSSIVSGKARFVACCSILYALAGSGAAVAQFFSSPGCQALENAAAFSLQPGETTGLFPVGGNIFYQGETIGADWSQTVFMDFQVWHVGDGNPRKPIYYMIVEIRIREQSDKHSIYQIVIMLSC